MTEPPIPLHGVALERWSSLVTAWKWNTAELVDLAAWCAAFGRWADAEAFVAANGTVITISDDKGNVKSHGPAPQLVIAERANKEMARLAKQLRLSQRVRTGS